MNSFNRFVVLFIAVFVFESVSAAGKILFVEAGMMKVLHVFNYNLTRQL
jgi:hypothetical protein